MREAHGVPTTQGMTQSKPMRKKGRDRRKKDSSTKPNNNTSIY
jgi:hypothetical protein